MSASTIVPAHRYHVQWPMMAEKICRAAENMKSGQDLADLISSLNPSRKVNTEGLVAYIDSHITTEERETLLRYTIPFILRAAVTVKPVASPIRLLKRGVPGIERIFRSQILVLLSHSLLCLHPPVSGPGSFFNQANFDTFFASSTPVALTKMKCIFNYFDSMRKFYEERIPEAFEGSDVMALPLDDSIGGWITVRRVVATRPQLVNLQFTVSLLSCSLLFLFFRFFSVFCFLLSLSRFAFSLCCFIPLLVCLLLPVPPPSSFIHHLTRPRHSHHHPSNLVPTHSASPEMIRLCAMSWWRTKSRSKTYTEILVCPRYCSAA